MLRRFCKRQVVSVFKASNLRWSSSMRGISDDFIFDKDFLLADSDSEDEEEVVRSKSVKYTIDEFGRTYGTGRRKTAVARVWCAQGSGQFVINNKNFADYFQPLHSEHAIEPLVVTSTGGMYDVWATVKGGGLMAQSGAIRLGLARALQVQEPFLRPTLKKAGCLTRDSRRVERKKPGQKKARKKFAWVKR